MARFAHMADVHLGGWKQQQLRDLNFLAFQKAIDVCISSKLDFVLIAGDLFDSPYPPIETLKETFAEFKRLKEARIPCFIIAGSHDYSVSGRTFLDVLEKAGFCKNVTDAEIIEPTSDSEKETIILNPTIHSGFAIYGYPGKKSGLEIEDLRKVKLNDAPGMFKIFMLHTTLDKAKGTLPVDAIEADLLPKADYYAMGHLHTDFQYQNFVYPGPLFPNNFQELEDLKGGGFYIVDTSSDNALKRIELKIKDVVSVEIEIKNSVYATEKIISELEKIEIEDKVVLLRVKGELENGKVTDIKFSKIEDFVKQKNAYAFLRNTHELKTKEEEMEIEIGDTEDIEEETIKVYSDQNPSDFNKLLSQVMNAFSIEKQEDERSEVFINRLFEGTRKILEF